METNRERCSQLATETEAEQLTNRARLCADGWRAASGELLILMQSLGPLVELGNRWHKQIAASQNLPATLKNFNVAEFSERLAVVQDNLAELVAAIEEATCFETVFQHVAADRQAAESSRLCTIGPLPDDSVTAIVDLSDEPDHGNEPAPMVRIDSGARLCEGGCGQTGAYTYLRGRPWCGRCPMPPMPAKGE